MIYTVSHLAPSKKYYGNIYVELLNLLQKEFKDSFLCTQRNAKMIKFGTNLEVWFSSNNHFSVRIARPSDGTVNIVRMDSPYHVFELNEDNSVLIIDNCIAFQITK